MKKSLVILVFILILSVTGCASKDAVAPPSSPVGSNSEPSSNTELNAESRSEPDTEEPSHDSGNLFAQAERLCEGKTEQATFREDGHSFAAVFTEAYGSVYLLCSATMNHIFVEVNQPDGMKFEYTIMVCGAKSLSDSGKPPIIEDANKWPQKEQEAALSIVKTITENMGDAAQIDAVIRSIDLPIKVAVIGLENPNYSISREYLNGCEE